MAWRKTGVFRPAEEIFVMTCDMCERDIGYEDGRRPHEHFCVTRLPNPGGMGDQEMRATAIRHALNQIEAKLKADGFAVAHQSLLGLGDPGRRHGGVGAVVPLTW